MSPKPLLGADGSLAVAPLMRVSTKRQSKTMGVALAALVVLVWSATIVNTKALLTDFSALEILCIRFAMAWIALWAIHPHGMGPLRLREEALFAAAGISGATAYQMLENVAIHFTNASNVGILVATSSLFAAIMSRLLLGERTFTPRFLIGCALALGGVVLVSLGGVHALHFSPIGDALALGAAVSWGVYSAAVTVVNRCGWHPVAAIRRAFFWALVFMLPLLLFALAAPETAAKISCSVNLSPSANATRFFRLPNLANLIFLGLLASACCFVAWNKACERLGTVRCSLGLYLIPVLAFLIAHVFLGETLPAAGVVGAILVLTGVAVAGSSKRQSRQDAP